MWVELRTCSTPSIRDPPDFVPFAMAVAGTTATGYHRKVVARAADLLNAIIDAGAVTAQ